MSLILPNEGPVFMIRRKDVNDPFFFLFDILVADIDIALWTPVEFKAREFYSEQSVEDFKYQFLNNRPCEIVMVR